MILFSLHLYTQGFYTHFYHNIHLSYQNFNNNLQVESNFKVSKGKVSYNNVQAGKIIHNNN